MKKILIFAASLIVLVLILSEPVFTLFSYIIDGTSYSQVVEHSVANEIINEIERVSVSQKAVVEYMWKSSSIYIQVLVYEGFTENSSLEVLKIVRKYLDAETLSELTAELEPTNSLSVNINFRDVSGKMLPYSFTGKIPGSSARIEGSYADYSDFEWK